jgi:drug/metabolite transporter (DMT)-like permease
MSSCPQHDQRRAGLGAALALVSVGLFAVSPTLARLSYDAGAGPLSANVFRGFLLFSLFAIVLTLHPQARTGARNGSTARRSRFAATALGLSYAAFAWIYQLAISEIGAGPALVAASASAILVVLWQGRPIQARKSHPVGMPELAAALVTVAGVYLLAGDTHASTRSLIYCFLIMVCCAVMTIATERAAEAGVTFVQRGRAIGLGMLLLVIPLALGYQEIPATPPQMGAAWWALTLPGDALGWCAFLGSAVTMIGAISLYSAAIGHIGAVRVSLIANAEPALGLAIAWIGAGETLGTLGVLGGILASAGLVDWRRMTERAVSAVPSLPLDRSGPL